MGPLPEHNFLIYTLKVAALTAKYDRARREFARREDETAKLLDVRNHKINKLELQLRDIAYGTKLVKIEPTSDSESPADYNISLERGQVLVVVLMFFSGHFQHFYLIKMLDFDIRIHNFFKRFICNRC